MANEIDALNALINDMNAQIQHALMAQRTGDVGKAVGHLQEAIGVSKDVTALLRDIQTQFKKGKFRQ